MTSQTSAGPCAYSDSYLSASATSPIPQDPQQVWINGVRLAQAARPVRSSPASSYYDWSARRLRIAVNPSGNFIEATSRPVGLVLANASIVVRGIGIRNYASSQYPGIDEAAVFAAGGPFVFDHDVFTDNSAGGIGFSNPKPGTLVEFSQFVSNGFDAIGGNGSANGAKTANGLVIQSNLIQNNNSELFDQNCTYACGSAGIKIAHMVGFTLTGNTVSGNNGNGLWCDEDCTGGAYINNVVTGNTKTGILHEVSDAAVIANNVVSQNGTGGITVASANTDVYNNTLIGNVSKGIWVYDDGRSPEKVV